MPQPASTSSTADLLARVRAGDLVAREHLIRRYLPLLRGIAHGRLPRTARGMVDTDDLVQNTLEKALNHLDTFEPRHEGAFLAYLRRSVIHHVIDEVRRARRKPEGVEAAEQIPSLGPSPLDELIGRDLLERYEKALEDLSEQQREAVILRLEMGYSYGQIAQALGDGTPNAVRMTIQRALARIATRMKKEGDSR